MIESKVHPLRKLNILTACRLAEQDVRVFCNAILAWPVQYFSILTTRANMQSWICDTAGYLENASSFTVELLQYCQERGICSA